MSASSATLRPLDKLIPARPQDIWVIIIDCDGSLTRTVRTRSALTSAARDNLFTNF